MRYILLIFLFFSLSLHGEDKIPLIRGEVQHINKKGVTLNIGTVAGVTLGMVFDAYDHNKSYKLPLSGEIVVKEGEIVGHLKVVELSENFCICRKPEKFQPFIGQLVLGRGVAVQGNQPPRIEAIKFDKKNIHWGMPLKIEIQGSDLEGKALSATGKAEKGHLIHINHLQFSWYPPRGNGKVNLEFNLSDGIAYSKKSVVIEHKSIPQPHFVNPTTVIGTKRFSFETIDQLIVDEKGHIWILDISAKAVMTLSDSLKEIRRISLNDISPKRFTVNQNKIAVLGEKRIFTYNYSGKLTGRMGSQGSKIHQWEEAHDLLLLKNNTLAVLDSEKQTILLFNEKGFFIASCGYPAKTSPGFLKATWLERHNNGFAVLDLDQRHRLIFDAQFRFKESFPLDKITLPLSGPGESRAIPLPPEVKTEQLVSVARSLKGEWLAVDQKGKRLLKFSDSKNKKILSWNLFSGEQRLTTKDNIVFWLNQENEKLFQISFNGWRSEMSRPKNMTQLHAFYPSSPKLFLDQNSCRIYEGNEVYGQAGSGKSMLDEPDDILKWGKFTAVLDKDNNKVVLFKDKGLMETEMAFENCQTFCVNHKNELLVLGERGKMWTWPKPSMKPTVSERAPESEVLRSIGNQYIILTGTNKALILDETFKILQQIFISSPKDAVLTDMGELWIFSGTHGLIKYHIK